MKCPKCKCSTEVVDSRSAYEKPRRRRLCKKGHRFRTIEIMVPEGGCANAVILSAPKNQLKTLLKLAKCLRFNVSQLVVADG